MSDQSGSVTISAAKYAEMMEAATRMKDLYDEQNEHFNKYIEMYKEISKAYDDRVKELKDRIFQLELEKVVRDCHVIVMWCSMNVISLHVFEL